jgi:hypothetical protein
MRRLLIGSLLTAPLFASLFACASPAPAEETSSQSSKSESLECLPISFSLCDGYEVGYPETRTRYTVFDYSIWGEPDGYGNCIYGGIPRDQIEPTIREALANGRAPEGIPIWKQVREMCGFTPDTCGIIVDDRREGLPIVYGKCLDR